MKLNIIIWQEGSLWIAKCLENSIASQGKTRIEAKNNLNEALELTFEDSKQDEFPKISHLESEELIFA